jgi:D-alanine-D-alanine ligase
MRKLRILLLVHESLEPPFTYEELPADEFEPVKTEYDVRVDLEHYGHDVRVVGIADSLAPLRHALREFEPHVVFNLLEEFHDERIHSHAVVSYLELMQVPYTGCNPRGLALAQDKAISKTVLAYHGIPTPGFEVVPRGRSPKRRELEFPLIVKSLLGDASEGLSQASVVHSDEKLRERVTYIHRTFGDALIEEYIPGREVYCGVLGYRRLEALPVWELRMTKLRPTAPNIATQRVKWDLAYQQRIGVEIGRARGLSAEVEARLQKLSKRAFSLLNMTGWGRMDFRLTEAGKPYFLEANPNADIATDEEFASAAEAAGYSYIELLHRIINIGLRAAGK